MWAALASSALLFFASYGLGEFWPLAWIAPSPVWIYCWRERKHSWISGAAYLLGSLNLAAYYLDVLPLPIAAVALVFPALLFWGLTKLATRCTERSGWIAGVFAFPAFWTAIEWIRTQTSEHGAAGSLANSQTDFVAALQVVSVTGFLGLTFLLLLIPSALACYWITRRALVLAAPAALLSTVLIYGAIRLGSLETSVAAVGAVASDGPNVSVESYASRVDALAARGAKYIVLPEKFVRVNGADHDRIYRTLSDSAARNSVTVVSGLTLVEGSKLRNVAVVFGPRGETRGTYDKRHMVPGWEAEFAAGSRTLVIDNFGVAICKDFDFPSLTAEYAEQGVAMMFAPAWDFTRDAKLHSRMAVMRSVEHGFSLVRAARQGRVTVSDAYGRILDEASTIGATEASVVVLNAPARAVPTLYARFGDWFGVVSCVVALVFALRIFQRLG